VGDSKRVIVNKPLQPFGKDLKPQTYGRGESVIGNIKTIIAKILIPVLATEASKEPIETKRVKKRERIRARVNGRSLKKRKR
jgi:hypothetical protein